MITSIAFLSATWFDYCPVHKHLKDFEDFYEGKYLGQF